jgi:murein DD-endopeptidase MepM/ murein hydrolase activator NlpD
LTRSRARAVSYGLITLLAWAALRWTQPLPEHLANEPLVALQGTPMVENRVREGVDTLGRGEALAALLTRQGLSSGDAAEVIRASNLDDRRIPAGMPVTVRAAAHPDSQPNELVFQLAMDRLVRLRRTVQGWQGAEERIPWRTDTVAVAGTIQSTLYDAMKDAAADLPSRARTELAWSIADIFEYRVDMSRDLQKGDAFRALVERQVSPSGQVRMGNVLAASFTLSGSVTSAVRFASREVGGSYFDQNGKSMRAAFLRAPLEFRRISSVFGFRVHPILGIRKKHQGTDYAAASGTPVRAIGDGTVIRANWSNGYGNVLEIRHRNGFVTRYGHLRGYAKGIRTGARVTIGQKVAFVGTTGLSTAPHLHFEVLVGGVQRDPRVALRDASRGGEPVPSSERGAFEATRSQLFAALDRGAPMDVASK